MSSEAVLRLDDIKVRFGGLKAVDGVTLSLAEGRLAALVGPNGSGKTTLVNTISKLVSPTAGRIWFGGTDVTSAPPHELYRRGLARTFQGIRLVDDLSVRENVMLGLDQKSRTRSRGARASVRAAADEALRRLDVLDAAELRPSSLPYGLQRRVEIARAVAGEPRVLLLDEPVAGMSTGERHEISEVLHQLRRDGITMVLIEHDLQFVLGLSDRLHVLNFGTLIAEGEPTATAALPVVQEAFLGRTHVSS